MNAPGKTPFSEFCHAVYESKPRGGFPKNRQTFVRALIESTGSKSDGLSDALAQKYYQGVATLTWPFPDPIDGAGVISYLHSHLKQFRDHYSRDQAVKRIANKLGLDAASLQPEHALRALAFYLNNIVNRPDKIDALSDYYCLCVENPDLKLTSINPQSFQSGDHATNFSANQYATKVFGLYQVFRHEWRLMNDGEMAWSGRALVCTNPMDPAIRPSIDRVSIPDCEPSRASSHTVSVDLEIQHAEGRLKSRWLMVDSDGNDCFPDEPGKFDIIVQARFRPPHAWED